MYPDGRGHSTKQVKVLQGPCPPLHRTAPLKRYIRAEPQDIPVLPCCCKGCANSPTLEEHWQRDAGRAMQQNNMFQWGVHCLVIIWCPPLSGDWFTAYPTTWCLHLHCLHHGHCVTFQGCMAIFLQRTWACKTLLPFRPGLVRLWPAGRHRESVLPVVWENFMGRKELLTS